MSALREPPPLSTVTLGHTQDGTEVGIDPEALKTHVQFVGLSGKGKSRTIEHVVRQLILQGAAGLLFIDPHGEVYEPLVEWCARQGPAFLQRRKVHLFDPADPQWRMAFNPLNVPEGGEIADRVDLVLDAVAQVMGGEELERMPLYQRTFGAIIYALAARRLTLLETMLALPATQDAFRRWLTENLPDPVVHAVWQEMHGWKPREYTEFMSSTFSRVNRLLRSPIIRSVLCQTERVIDCRRIMDEGHIVLANFKPREGFKGDSPLILGRLLINSLFSTALERKANASRPFFLIVDEAYQYLNDDIEKMLDQTRKFGLHAMLAYQRLEQLRQRGENIYSGVMHGCQTKVVFGTTYDTAIELADDLFAATYDLERPKHSLDKPVVTGYETIPLKQHTEGAAHARSRGGSVSHTVTENDTEGGSEHIDPETLEVKGISKTGAKSTASAEGETATWQDTHSKNSSDGVSEALKPILTTMVSQVHSLEEERHRAALQLTQLQRQQAYVQLPDKTVHKITTHEVQRPKVRPERLEAFKQQAFVASEFTTPVVELEQRVEERWRELELRMREPVVTIEAEEVEQEDGVQWK